MGFVNFLSNSVDLIIVFVVSIALQQFFNIFVDRFAVERLYRVANKRGKAVSKKRLDTVGNAFKKIFGVIVWSLALLIVLGLLGFDVVKILAALGALSIVLTIIWKDAITDMYYGFLVLIQNNYRVGDYVVVDSDHAGIVDDITFLTVKLKGDDGSLHVIPHSHARIITNKTYHQSVLRIVVNVQDDTDIDKTIVLINKLGVALAAQPEWKKLFIEPLTYQSLLGFDEKTVSIVLTATAKPDKRSAVLDVCKLRLMQLLKKHKISASLEQ